MIRRLCLVALLLGLPLKIGENKVNPINLEELILDPPKTEIVQNEIVQNEVEEVSIDIDKIICIESSRDPIAYHKYTKARGLMQITPIVLEEWNNFHPSEQYILDELFNPEINVKIGTWYLDRIKNHYLPHYGIDQTIDNIIIAYDWGIGRLHKIYEEGDFDSLPEETKEYIRKYKEE